MKANPDRWRLPETGLWGFSHCASYDSWYPWSGAGFESRLSMLSDDLVSSGANSFRPHIHWHRVEPLIEGEPLRLESVTDGMVEAYSRGRPGVEWRPYDDLVDSLLNAGVVPHMVLGAAYDFQLPSFCAGGTTVRATPDSMGREHYLARLYLHARAAVRRYRGRVHVWQLENELNVAAETMVFMRWRSGGAWLDGGFRDSVIEVLELAVRRENEVALTSHNFHTDVRVLKGVYDWRSDVRRWLKRLDVVGIDCYPNYLLGVPVRGRSVGKKVQEAAVAGEGRPVMVLESGYPVRPAHRGMSEARQAEYVREAIGSAVEAGADGFYYYLLCSPEGYPVEGPWSNRLLQSVEPWWGLVRRDGTRRPAWFEFSRAAAYARIRRTRDRP